MPEILEDRGLYWFNDNDLWNCAYKDGNKVGIKPTLFLHGGFGDTHNAISLEFELTSMYLQYGQEVDYRPWLFEKYRNLPKKIDSVVEYVNKYIGRAAHSNSESIEYRNKIFDYVNHYTSTLQNNEAAAIREQDFNYWNDIEKNKVENRLEYILRTVAFNSDPETYLINYITLSNNLFFNYFEGERTIENLWFNERQDIKDWTSLIWETLKKYRYDVNAFRSQADFTEMDDLIADFNFDEQNPFNNEWTDEILGKAQKLHELVVAIFGRITYLKMLEGSAMFKEGVLIPLAIPRRTLARNVLKNHLILKGFERYHFIKENPAYTNDYETYLLGSSVQGVKIRIEISGETKYIDAMNMLDYNSWDSSNPSLIEINNELEKKSEEENRDFIPITRDEYSLYLINIISSQYQNWESDASIGDDYRTAMVILLDKLMDIWDSQVGRDLDDNEKKYYFGRVQERLAWLLTQATLKYRERRQIKEALLYKQGAILDFSKGTDSENIRFMSVIHLTGDHFKHEGSPLYGVSQYLSSFIKLTAKTEATQLYKNEVLLPYQKDELISFIKSWQELLVKVAKDQGSVYLVPFRSFQNGFG